MVGACMVRHFTGNEKTFLDALTPDVGDAAASAGKSKKAPKPIEKHVARLTLIFDEQSIAERRDLSRGLATIEQQETVYIVSKNVFQAERKNRINYGGTSSGSVIGPIAVPSPDDQWQLKFEHKKRLFGAARVAVGGRTPGTGAAVGESMRGKSTNRGAEDMEPVMYHAKGEKIDEELLWMLDTKAKPIGLIIDGTPGDAGLAHIAAKKRIPYFGHCFTEEHATQSRSQVHKLVFQDFQTEGNPLYKPALVTLMQMVADPTEDGNGGTGGSGPAPKAKSKGKAKAKAGKGRGRGCGRARGHGGAAIAAAAADENGENGEDGEGEGDGDASEAPDSGAED